MVKVEGELQQPKGASFLDTPLTDPNFDRKLDAITAGAKPFVKEHLLTRISGENSLTIVNYILTLQTEVGPSESYRIDTILKLRYFSTFHNSKPFSEMNRQDVIDFLDSFRKPEQVDPLHKWVGTREAYRIILMRFFRWLYAPELSQRQRPRPAVMENVPKIKRKEVSIYKPTDLWTEEDDYLFASTAPLHAIGAGTPLVETLDAGPTNY